MNRMLGQCLFIGIAGKTLSSEERNFIVANNIGGVVLFGRNCESPEQLHALCSQIHECRNELPDRAPMMIGIDMEGGRVARLKPPFTQWPPLKTLGDLDHPPSSFHFAWNMGRELRAIGVNLDFAPCLDILTNSENKVIGDRSIGSDPELVARHATALVRGYIKAGILTCGKHFPGHGNTFIDSHEELPKEQTEWSMMQHRELIPFARAIKARVDMIMSAHILYERIDPTWPATLSHKFMTSFLREELRYRGIAVTDDLGMKALAKYWSTEDIPVRALQAGADMLLYCNEPTSPPIALESLQSALAQGTLPLERVQDAYSRIMLLKKQRLNEFAPLPLDEMKKVINDSEHQRVVEAIRSGVKLPDLVNEA